MDDRPPYDPRQIANELVDLGRKFMVDVTHLSLQKIVYFLHEAHLKEGKGPLCTGYFEAWKHGPVHPQLWSTFKAAGRSPIRHHAYGLDIETGAPRALERIADHETRLYLLAEGARLLRTSAPRLVGLSHARGTPWDTVAPKIRGQREYGARITNELILKCRVGIMLPVDESEADEEDLYEQPPT